MIQPPRAGPTIDEMPKTDAVNPCHLPRSAGGKISPMMAIAIGITAPAPRPWIARKMMSWVMVCDVPESAEPIRKITIPAM